MLLDRGLACSAREAKALIMEGRVFLNSFQVLKPGDMISREAVDIEITPGRQYVSRGGHKLESAFESFGLTVEGKTALDIGSSTGGFTDYLLQNGASQITAIDVGKGLLSWKLRKSERVRLLEETNIRYLDPSILDYRAEMAVVDLSFISVSKVFGKIFAITSEDAEILILIKPQFELKSEFVKHKGIVKEKKYHKKALCDFVAFLKNFNVSVEGITFSRVKGAAGNIEFWIYLKKSIISAESNINYDKIIGDAIDGAHLFFDKDRSSV